MNGTNPPFDAGTTGTDVLPLGRRIISPVHEVQTVSILGRSYDLDGSMQFQFRGASSLPVHVNASSSAVQFALESIAGVEGVSVAKEVITFPEDVPPFGHAGVRYTVTFSSI